MSATLSRSVEVKGDPASVWASIGAYCAIAAWHPAIASCETNDQTPPTRTLTTREGGARFVELQTEHDDARHAYTYTFTSSPLPVTHYRATFSVKAIGPNASSVTWRGSYLPKPGQAVVAHQALSGIYEGGLTSIQRRLGKAARPQGGGVASNAAPDLRN